MKYWSSVPSWDYYCAWNLYSYSSGYGVTTYRRYLGHSVRPVQGFTK